MKPSNSFSISKDIAKIPMSINSTHLMVSLLIVIAFILRSYAALSVPFLHDWDERFHALVAKNLSIDPSIPLLIKYPLTGYDYTDWSSNHIWLHKPPLFLYQMALSIKVLGATEWAVRFPSVVMGSVQTGLIFGLGRKLVNLHAGYIAALLWAVSGFSIQLTNGQIGMDHNDVCFAFYTTLAFYYLVLYTEKPSTARALIIGLVTSLAILTKWLPGLIIYFAWVVYLVFTYVKSRKPIPLYDIFLSGGLTLGVCAIWYAYTFARWPAESMYELLYNFKHVSQAVEKHVQDQWFYLDQARRHYLPFPEFFLLAGFYCWLMNTSSLGISRALVASYVLVYLFFTFIPETKLPAYTFLVSSIGFVAIGAFIEQGIQHISQKNCKAIARLLIIAFLAILCIKMLRPIETFKLNPTKKQQLYDQAKSHNTKVWKSLATKLDPKQVLINLRSYENIEALFYTDNPVLKWWPPPEQIDSLHCMDYEFVVLPYNGLWQEYPKKLLELDGVTLSDCKLRSKRK